MREKLWTKFALSHLAIAIIAVASAAILFNFALSKKFQGYVEENQKLKDEQMVILLGSIYEKDGQWNSQRMQDVGNLSMMSGREITVLDSAGRQVFDCWDSMREMRPEAQKRMMGTGMMCEGGWDQQRQGYGAPRVKSGPPSKSRPNPQNVESRRVPVFVGEKQVGTAVIKPIGNQGLFSPQDRSFQANVNRWLWGVALGAGAFALLISLGMARHLSQPIRALTTATRTLRNGDLTQRLRIEGKDEVGQLADAFNHLAESLQKQEQYRKKLTADLAHELRTPLANLQTHTEALIDGVLPTTSENLTSVHEEILRLGRLIRSLEELSRAEASRLTLRKEKVDLKVFLERTTSLFQPQFADKGVVLKTSLPEYPMDIPIDRDKISQVINNLLSNALKFTAEGGDVEVKMKRQEQEVQITVKDTGIGIPDGDIPFIFERFFRAGNGENGARGSGIGLTIAKELTEAHGGKLGVNSRQNQGAEFTVSLPLST